VLQRQQTCVNVGFGRYLTPNHSSAPLGIPGRSVGVRRETYDAGRAERGHVATKAIVGEKVGMTQVWDDQNRAIPVTVLKVAPVRVVQVKTPESDGYSALQVTWGFRRNSTLTKPQIGHYAKAGVNPGRKLVELRLDDVSEYAVGQELAADLWSAGERVDAIAVSKGKGFAGGMKRHNFKGQGGAHGNHGHHRAPGSIGACATPSRVFKGTRMAGQMGGSQVTALNLVVVSADPERELVLVKGAVPGARGSVVVLRDTVKAPSKAGKR
jgi:large subunit ribosomal protein L3